MAHREATICFERNLRGDPLRERVLISLPLRIHPQQESSA
jgi:hypothetical protein